MSPSASAGRKAGTLQAIVLILPTIMAIMATAALVPVMPKVAAEYADSPNAQLLAQLVLTLPSLLIVICSPLAGWLGDRMGRRRLLIAAMALYVVVGLLPIVVKGLALLLFCRALLGVCEAAVLTLATALLGDNFTGLERNKWIGYQPVAGSIAGVLLFPLAGYLGDFGWRYAFGIYALPLIMLALVLRFTWEPEPNTEEQAATGPAPFPWSWMLAGSVVGLSASVMYFTSQLQTGAAFSAIGIVDSSQIGLWTSVAAIGAVIGAVIFRFINPWPTTVLTAIGFGAMGAGLLGMGLAGNPGLVTLAIFTAQIGGGIILPALLTWVVRRLPFEMRGRGVGIWQGVFAVGMFGSSMAFGAMLQSFGTAPPVFRGFGGVALAAAAIALALTLAGRAGSGLLRRADGPA